MLKSKVDRYNYFVSEHNPPGKYNEHHPCGIVRTKWREQGWYLNSFYRISRFTGYKIGRVSFGFVSGYKKYRIPYICYHWDGGFTLPVGIISWMMGSEMKYIRCTYAERNTWTSNIKLWWKKLRK